MCTLAAEDHQGKWTFVVNVFNINTLPITLYWKKERTTKDVTQRFTCMGYISHPKWLQIGYNYAV